MSRCGMSDVRVVIDTNRLRSPELLAFLMLDVGHRAVLNEWVAIETYKQEQAAGVLASYKVLSGFPDQVVVLHGTARAAQLGRTPDAMVNQVDTLAFPFFARAMARAHAGDGMVLAQVSERRGWALGQIAAMEAELPDSAEVLKTVRAMLTDEQWARFARGEVFSARMRELFSSMVVTVADLLATHHPARIRLPDPPALYSEFTYRLALSLMIHLFNLARDGARTRNREQSLNDRIDVFHITYATYFNGLMTSDARCGRTHAAVRAALRGAGAELAEDYLDTVQGRVEALVNERRAMVGKGPVATGTL